MAKTSNIAPNPKSNNNENLRANLFLLKKKNRSQKNLAKKEYEKKIKK